MQSCGSGVLLNQQRKPSKSHITRKTMNTNEYARQRRPIYSEIAHTLKMKSKELRLNVIFRELECHIILLDQKHLSKSFQLQPFCSDANNQIREF